MEGEQAPVDDAPLGHISFKKIIYRATHASPLAQFKFTMSDGKVVPFQTTLAKCGSKEECLRIARLCWLELEKGKTKEEVTAFRNAEYAKLGSQGAKPIRKVQEEKDRTQLAIEDSKGTTQPAPQPDITNLKIDDDTPLSQILRGKKHESSSSNMPATDARQPGRPGGMQLAVGDQVEYHSISNQRWVPATVTLVNPGGSIEIHLKKGWLITPELQEKCIRRLPQQPQQPRQPQVPAQLAIQDSKEGSKKPASTKDNSEPASSSSADGVLPVNVLSASGNHDLDDSILDKILPDAPADHEAHIKVRVVGEFVCFQHENTGLLVDWRKKISRIGSTKAACRIARLTYVRCCELTLSDSNSGEIDRFYQSLCDKFIAAYESLCEKFIAGSKYRDDKLGSVRKKEAASGTGTNRSSSAPPQATQSSPKKGKTGGAVILKSLKKCPGCGTPLSTTEKAKDHLLKCAVSRTVRVQGTNDVECPGCQKWVATSMRKQHKKKCVGYVQCIGCQHYKLHDKIKKHYAKCNHMEECTKDGQKAWQPKHRRQQQQQDEQIKERTADLTRAASPVPRPLQRNEADVKTPIPPTPSFLKACPAPSSPKASATSSSQLPESKVPAKRAWSIWKGSKPSGEKLGPDRISQNKGITCYRCGEFGHTRVDCPQKDSTSVRPGDWTCPGCGASVFASKRKCFKCGEPNPNPKGVGKGGTGGGKRDQPAKFEESWMNDEVDQLCSQFDIDDHVKSRLVSAMLTRTDTFKEDIASLTSTCERANNPPGLLCVKIREMEDGTFVAKGGDKGGSKGKGKGKGKGAGREDQPVKFEESWMNDEVDELCSQFDIDDRVKSRLMSAMLSRTDTFKEDITSLTSTCQVANNPPGLLCVKIREMEDGTFVAKGGDKGGNKGKGKGKGKGGGKGDQHAKFEESWMNDEVDELCSQFDIDDRVKSRLMSAMLSRTDTFEEDMKSLTSTCKGANNPPGLLCVKIREMEDGTFVAKDSGKAKECHNCGELGHVKKDCPKLKCHSCGLQGHISRDCPQRHENRAEFTGDSELKGKGKDKDLGYEVKGNDQDDDDQTWGNILDSIEKKDVAESDTAKDDQLPHVRGDRPMQKCYSCGEEGHIRRDCPKRRMSREEFAGEGKGQSTCKVKDTSKEDTGGDSDEDQDWGNILDGIDEKDEAADTGFRFVKEKGAEEEDQSWGDWGKSKSVGKEDDAPRNHDGKRDDAPRNLVVPTTPPDDQADGDWGTQSSKDAPEEEDRWWQKREWAPSNKRYNAHSDSWQENSRKVQRQSDPWNDTSDSWHDNSHSRQPNRSEADAGKSNHSELLSQTSHGSHGTDENQQFEHHASVVASANAMEPVDSTAAPSAPRHTPTPEDRDKASESVTCGIPLPSKCSWLNDGNSVNAVGKAVPSKCKWLNDGNAVNDTSPPLAASNVVKALSVSKSATLGVIPTAGTSAAKPSPPPPLPAKAADFRPAPAPKFAKKSGWLPQAPPKHSDDRQKIAEASCTAKSASSTRNNSSGEQNAEASCAAKSLGIGKPPSSAFAVSKSKAFSMKAPVSDVPSKSSSNQGPQIPLASLGSSNPPETSRSSNGKSRSPRPSRRHSPGRRSRSRRSPRRRSPGRRSSRSGARRSPRRRSPGRRSPRSGARRSPRRDVRDRDRSRERCNRGHDRSYERRNRSRDRRSRSRERRSRSRRR